MKLLRSIGTMAAVFLLAFSVSLYSFKAARGSDHQDSPTVVKNPLADITDVYAFPDPHDASRVALAMDVRPLIPDRDDGRHRSRSQRALSVQDRHSGVASNSFKEDTVIQFTADSAGTSQRSRSTDRRLPTKSERRTRSSPRPERSRSARWQSSRAHQGLRRTAARSVLLRSRAVLQDRSGSQLHEPSAHAAGDRDVVPLRIGVTADHSQRRRDYGTAGSNGCVIKKPHDYLAPYDVLSIVIEMPKKMLAPAERIARSDRPVGDDRHARRPVGIGDCIMKLRYTLGLIALALAGAIAGGCSSNVVRVDSGRIAQAAAGSRRPANSCVQADRTALAAGRQGSLRDRSKTTTRRIAPSPTRIRCLRRRSNRSRTMFRSKTTAETLQAVLYPNVMKADLSQNTTKAAYLGYETGGATGSKFGGRALDDDIIDISLGAHLRKHALGARARFPTITKKRLASPRTTSRTTSRTRRRSRTSRLRSNREADLGRLPPSRRQSPSGRRGRGSSRIARRRRAARPLRSRPTTGTATRPSHSTKRKCAAIRDDQITRADARRASICSDFARPATSTTSRAPRDGASGRCGCSRKATSRRSASSPRATSPFIALSPALPPNVPPLEAAPFDDGARAQTASILMELGRYERGRHAFSLARADHDPNPTWMSIRARYDELTGNLAGARVADGAGDGS